MTKKSLLYPFFSLALSACTLNKNNYYSYKINVYEIDSIKNLKTTSSLISYGDYLFEFNVAEKTIAEQHGNNKPVVTSKKYDTASVYLLSVQNKLYYEFDSFLVKNNLKKTGKRSEKEFGKQFTNADTLVSNKNSFEYSKMIDTIVNDINCTYLIINDKKGDYKDSYSVKMLFIKNKNFNSFFKIEGAVYYDKNYCIIGNNIIDLKNNVGIITEIDNLRPLTKNEIKICQNMIVKSKICIIDTIKGIREMDKKPIVSID